MEQNNQLVYIPVDDSSGLRKYKAYYKKGGRYLYCTRKKEDVSVNGLRRIYIHEYFPNMLIRRALQQLDEYLDANRQNAEMYQYDAFWEDALQFAGRPIIPSTPYALDTHVEKGYISIYTSDSYRKERLVYCHYDLLEERLYLKYISWRREDEIPPQDFMDYLFGGLQQQILAQRQLDDGVMPEPCRAAYLEISRINRFMKGKRTVRAWFDGREKGVLCYPRDIQTAAFIIRLEDTKFVNFLYNYRHDEQGNIVKPGELTALPYKLSHYSEELTLQPDVFSELKLMASDPKLRAKQEQEANEAKMRRIVEESGGGYFYEIAFLIDGYATERMLTTQNCCQPQTLVVWKPTRDRIQTLYLKMGSRLEVSVTRYTIGSTGKAPLQENMLELIRALPCSRWETVFGCQKEKWGRWFKTNDLYEALVRSPALDSSEQKALKMVRLFDSVPKDMEYLFTVLELEGEHISGKAVVSGHPYGDSEIYRLEPVQKFLTEHPQGKMLTIYPTYLTVGDGKSRPMPDDLMLLLSGLDPCGLLMERKFGVRSLKPDEYRFVPKECA